MNPKAFASNAPGSLQFDPAGFWSFHPYPLPPLFRWTDEQVTLLSNADRAIGRLAAKLETAPRGVFRVIAYFEAAASCRMAGLETDLVSLLKAGAGDPAPAAGEAAAAAYAQALLSAQERHPDQILSLREMEDLHSEVFSGNSENDASWGGFRPGQTWIGPPGATPADAVFVPPPPDVMMTALESLAAYINRPDRLPPLVRLGLIHYQLETIYPFSEANGRTTRLVSALLFCRFGLLPGPGIPASRWFEREADEYNRRLDRVRRENAFGDWLAFFLEGVLESCRWTEHVLTVWMETRAGCLQAVAGERTESRLEETIDFVLEWPFFSVGRLDEKMAGGNFKSAARVVTRLERLGLVEEITGQARNRIFRLRNWVDRLAEMD